MKSVTERCAELQTQLSSLRQAQDNQEKARVLGARREELEARRLKLTLAAASAAVLVKHEQLPAARLPDVAKAQQSCAVVRQRLDEDPESVTKGREYSLLLRRLDEINGSLDDLVQTAWSELVKRHEGGDERFLAQVERVPGQAAAVAAIRLARTVLLTASAQVPASDEQYQHFLTCSGALQEALGKVNRGDFPAEVLAFFKRAQSPAGAPLSLLTDGVRAWLERKGMVQGLRIRFGGEG